MARIATGALAVLLVVLACTRAAVEEYDYDYSGSGYYPYSGSSSYDYGDEEVVLTTPTPPVTEPPPPEDLTICVRQGCCLRYPGGESLCDYTAGFAGFVIERKNYYGRLICATMGGV